jgi:hypothetical protein
MAADLVAQVGGAVGSAKHRHDRLRHVLGRPLRQRHGDDVIHRAAADLQAFQHLADNGQSVFVARMMQGQRLDHDGHIGVGLRPALGKVGLCPR